MDQVDCLWAENPSVNVGYDLDGRSGSRHAEAHRDASGGGTRALGEVVVDASGGRDRGVEVESRGGNDPIDMSMCTIDVADQSYLDLPTSTDSRRRAGNRSSTPEVYDDARGYAAFADNLGRHRPNGGESDSRLLTVQPSRAVCRRQRCTGDDESGPGRAGGSDGDKRGAPSNQRISISRSTRVHRLHQKGGDKTRGCKREPMLDRRERVDRFRYRGEAECDVDGRVRNRRGPPPIEINDSYRSGGSERLPRTVTIGRGREADRRLSRESQPRPKGRSNMEGHGRQQRGGPSSGNSPDSSGVEDRRHLTRLGDGRVIRFAPQTEGEEIYDERVTVERRERKKFEQSAHGIDNRHAYKSGAGARSRERKVRRGHFTEHPGRFSDHEHRGSPHSGERLSGRQERNVERTRFSERVRGEMTTGSRGGMHDDRRQSDRRDRE
jgi:hypothetical protein